MWRRLPSSTRNQVRKAQRERLVVREGRSTDDVARFYRVFGENMRNLGTPVYTPRFFELVLELLSTAADLTLVELDGETVAGGITLAHGRHRELHWAASRRAACAPCPNMLLYWEVLARAVHDGMASLSFGRPRSGFGFASVQAPVGRCRATLALGVRVPGRRRCVPRFG